jgi:hypothetical protein
MDKIVPSYLSSKGNSLRFYNRFMRSTILLALALHPTFYPTAGAKPDEIARHGARRWKFLGL